MIHTQNSAFYFEIKYNKINNKLNYLKIKPKSKTQIKIIIQILTITEEKNGV